MVLDWERKSHIRITGQKLANIPTEISRRTETQTEGRDREGKNRPTVTTQLGPQSTDQALEVF